MRSRFFKHAKKQPYSSSTVLLECKNDQQKTPKGVCNYEWVGRLTGKNRSNSSMYRINNNSSRFAAALRYCNIQYQCSAKLSPLLVSL
jgi:hypothetical protein